MSVRLLSFYFGGSKLVRSLAKIEGNFCILSIDIRGCLQTSYIDKFLAFFDHLPPCVKIINVDKKSTFLELTTTYPPLLVNVICQLKLSQNCSYQKTFTGTNIFKWKPIIVKFRWLRKSNLGTFWGHGIMSHNSQNTIISFEYNYNFEPPE